MKKIVSVLCLFVLVIAAVVILATESPEERPTSTSAIDLEMNVDKARDKYEEWSGGATAETEETLGDAVRQADEKLSSVTAQADEAIEEAVGSAVEGAKEGFFESIKKSITEFFQKLTS